MYDHNAWIWAVQQKVSSKSSVEYKKEQNYVVDRAKRNILFIPLKPELFHSGMDKLFDYINNSSHQILIKIAIGHVEFEALHPFKDGNGRIDRMLIRLMLCTAGVMYFYFSGFLEEPAGRRPALFV